jgi:hypothetical protein
LVVTPKPENAPEAPAPLTVAASVAALEGVVLVLYALILIPSLTGERLAMGVTSVAFLAVYGGFLGFCAFRVWRLESWARAPIVMAQLIQIPVGLSFWGGGTSTVTVVLLLLAAIVLAGIFAPQSIAALEDRD